MGERALSLSLGGSSPCGVTISIDLVKECKENAKANANAVGSSKLDSPV